VLYKGETISKASARSIVGFNIVEAIKLCSDLLIDVGGHPMAAGFTVETKNVEALQHRLEEYAEKNISEDALKRVLRIDEEIPLSLASGALWTALRDFEPFGFGNMEPIFASKSVNVADVRLIGKDNKHLKLKIIDEEYGVLIDAVAFNMGALYGELKSNKPIDIAYSIDMNTWNGKRSLQLKIKDIHLPNR
jgi:single-stranded-DNA-specific exonuclease